MSDALTDAPTGGGAPKEPILPPDARFGRYHIIRLIGRGGMGQVYEAELEEIRHRFAPATVTVLRFR